MIISYQPTFRTYNSQNNVQHNNTNHLTTFKANPNSTILKFNPKDFFINIKGYGKDMKWAEKVTKITDNAVASIKENNSSDKVLHDIADSMKIANSKSTDRNLADHTGVLRVARKGYGELGTWANVTLQTPFGHQFGYDKYNSYTKRFAKVSIKPLENPYDDISLTDIFYSPMCKCGEMIHGNAKHINNALDKVSDKYHSLQKDYIQHPEKITENHLDNINSNIAEIRWIMAHATPWERGSDAISNTFMRALYKSMGIKTHPSKRGVSFDLEAYCTNLTDYKKNFANYFTKAPEIAN